ncbi:MAG: YabP/YqfC family sporulation protein [Lachnospiraceae bacterium]|nr:YabP/YqfC family sporulation protein [Lachnospiraceae bacterium]
MDKKKTELLKNSKRKVAMVESLNLPKDLMLGSAILTITGNSDLYIENYKGILEYTCVYIVLQTKTCQIIIEGESLSIDYYTNEDMKISGNIKMISWR